MKQQNIKIIDFNFNVLHKMCITIEWHQNIQRSKINFNSYPILI